MNKVRIDKWLWAARFYKTRSLAKTAIEGGKVHIDGRRTKPSKEIEVQTRLHLRLGWDEIELDVIALSDKRGGAPQAALLYQETQTSKNKRETNATQRRAMGDTRIKPASKPNSKERRKLQGVKRLYLDD